MDLKQFFSALGWLIAVIAGSIAIYQHYETRRVEKIGQVQDELKIIKTRFAPIEHGFSYGYSGFDKSGEIDDWKDTLWMYVTLRNFGSETIYLTSMDMTTTGPLKYSAYSEWPILGPDPEKNKGIRLKPGDEEEFKLHKGLRIDGIAKYICDNFGNATYAKVGKKYMVSSSTGLEKLKNWFIDHYGDDASIKLTFYHNYKKLIGEHTVYFVKEPGILGSGKDFQFEYLIGSILARLNEEQKDVPKLKLVVPDSDIERPLVDANKYREEYSKCLAINELKF